MTAPRKSKRIAAVAGSLRSGICSAYSIDAPTRAPVAQSPPRSADSSCRRVDDMPSNDNRFWASVKKTKRGCWLWMGRRNERGYGIDPGRRLAHCLAYELTKGPIPTGLFVCHTCDNPPCVRPDHLRLGTNFQNQRQAYRRGRLHNPWLIKNVEAGLRMEKRYGRTPEARRRALANYKVRRRRAAKRQAVRVDRIRLAWAQERSALIQGYIHAKASDGTTRIIPLGGRDLFYRDLSGEWDTPVTRPAI